MLRSASLKAAGLLTAALLLTGTGCATSPSTAPTSSPSSAAPTTAAPTAWKGQLIGPAPTIAAGKPKSALIRENQKLKDWKPGQVDAAWAQLRQVLSSTAQSPELVDPSKTLTAADFAAAAGNNLSEEALANLATIAPAAVSAEGDAPEALRPLMFWYGAQDVAAAPELRLAAKPYRSNTITKAGVTGVSSGTRNGLAFEVNTELVLNMVDERGAANGLTLVRVLQVAMVPNTQPSGPRWQVDGWTGRWQLLKPVGQKLPTATDDAKNFNPNGSGPQPTTQSTPSPAPGTTPGR